MKIDSLLCGALALGCLVPALCASSTPLAPSNLSPQPALDELDYEGFKKEFEKAQGINSKPRMSQLVRTNERFTIWWVEKTCIQIAEMSSDKLETIVADLRWAWNDVYETDFVDNMYSYYSLLNGTRRKQWFKLKAEYSRNHDRNAEAKTSSEIELAAREYEALALRFEELGDFYYSSECWIGFAHGMDEYKRKDDADLYQACEGYKRAIAAYERMDLKNRIANESIARYEILAKSGYDGVPGEGGEGPGAGPAGGPPAGPGQPGAEPGAQPGAATGPVVSPLNYEPIDPFDTVPRPNYGLDQIYPIWPQIALQGEGSSSTFMSQPDGPKIMRTGPSQVEIDVDGDGVGDAKIPMTGNFELVEVETGEGDSLRRWGFLATIGTEKDTYQKVEMNLAPTLDFMNLYYLPAASALADVGGTELRIFDDNFDGVYGSTPLTFYNIGTTSASIGQNELDSVQIGDAKRAEPWSEYLSIDGVWYQMAHTEDGQLEAKPVTPKLGRLAIDFGGLKPTWLVVRGVDSYANSYFDLSQGGKKGVELPVGRYQLFYGEVRKGKKREEMKALIVPGREKPVNYTVSQGETTTIQLGAPFKFDFETRVEGEMLTVIGETVTIVGRGAERYERTWNCRPSPEASWRAGGSKRGSKAEDMKLMDNQWDASEKGWQYFWFPYDLALELKSGTESPEVQLFEKKNKLFGKIESDWK